MIILEKTNHVKFQGDLENIKVSIDEKSISHFFRMISNLYQDPVMAVLREIGANCVDAIKEAKTESIGWELHLPSRMDGNVRFVDNGVGISHEQMIRIYSIIGASSKRNDNNLIGGFGVGKWSLCSLVNNFQAISRFNGLKSYYFVCLQQNGLPDIKIVKQEKTNERNGFEVKFLCPEKYVYEFHNKVSKAYKFFDVKPKVFSSGSIQEIAYDEEKPLFSSKEANIDIMPGKRSQSVIEMGGVGYRLSCETLFQNKRFERFTGLLAHNLVIHAPIGEYSITPSREAIQLDDITMNRLEKKLQEFIDSFIPSIQKEMDNFVGNTWEAKRKAKELTQVFDFLPKSIKLTWKGKAIDALPLEVKDLKIKCFSLRSYYKKVSIETEADKLVAQNNTYLFLDDLPRGGNGRCKNFLQKERDNSNWTTGAVYILKKSEKDEFIKQTGWEGEFQKTSSLPVPLDNTSVNLGKKKLSAKTLRVRTANSWNINESLKPIDVNCPDLAKMDQFILFPTFSNKVAGRCSSVVDTFISLVIDLSKKNTRGLFITKKEYDVFAQNETLLGKPIIKITDFLKDEDFCKKFKAKYQKLPFDEMMEKIRELKGWSHRARHVITEVYKMNNSFSSDHLIQKCCGKIFDLTGDSKQMGRNLEAVIREFNKTLVEDIRGKSFDSKLNDIIDSAEFIVSKYPLLDCFAEYHEPKKMRDEAIAYIKMKDSIKN